MVEQSLDVIVRQWRESKAVLTEAKKLEVDLRNQIFQQLFPAPMEGTNTYTLPDGAKVKGTYKYYRKVDEAAIADVMNQLPEEVRPLLIRFKPEVNVKVYKSLPEQQRMLFEEALIIKPGTPGLDYIPPPAPQGE